MEESEREKQRKRHNIERDRVQSERQSIIGEKDKERERRDGAEEVMTANRQKPTRLKHDDLRKAVTCLSTKAHVVSCPTLTAPVWRAIYALLP